MRRLPGWRRVSVVERCTADKEAPMNYDLA